MGPSATLTAVPLSINHLPGMIGKRQAIGGLQIGSSWVQWVMHRRSLQGLPCVDTAQAQGVQPALLYQGLQDVALPHSPLRVTALAGKDDRLQDHLSPLWERQVSLPLQKRRECMGPAQKGTQKGSMGETFGKAIADCLWGMPLSLVPVLVASDPL